MIPNGAKVDRWDERNLVENAAVDLIQLLGYTYVTGEKLKSERAKFSDAVLGGRLAAALRRLNPWLSDANVRLAIRRVTRVAAADLLEANQAIYTSLIYGVALEQDRGDGRKSHTVRFFDFDEPERNDWVVTQQYRVRGAKTDILPDIVVFVNGLPLVVIECKNPIIGRGWKAKAIAQLRRYQEAEDQWKLQGAPKLFETAQVLIGTCGQRAVYGTTGTVERYYLEWKEPHPLSIGQLTEKIERTPTPQDILLYGLLERRNLLDIVRNFVVFEVEGGRTVRKLARYKQFIAVYKAMERIRTAQKPNERGGVIWHTQGSGKSLTMLWLALKLRRDRARRQPTVIVVTDRTKLESQIVGVFRACGFPNPERATSVRGLRRMLEHPTGRTLMTTIQKFQDLEARDIGDAKGFGGAVLSNAPNIFVMVDEAHRSQYRSLAANMRQALPNACFLGFTGTPIDKEDRSTLRTFGSYIDTYTIEQSVRDGTTVPIIYQSRLPKLQIVGQTLDELFDQIFADRSDVERAAIKRHYATEQAIAGAPLRISAVCSDLIEHYTKSIAPSCFKAQIVTVSRHAAVTYKETLDRLNGPESAVIMSASYNDEDRLARWHLTRREQDLLIERFKDRKDRLSILIVCDMLLTGFDAPAEQVLYLDAPLKEHGLLQAIARVNRPCGDDKACGLVVDYWGVTNRLREALAIFSETDVHAALAPREDELPKLESRHGAAMRVFQEIKDRGDLDACVRVLDPENVRAEFDSAFRNFSRSMEILFLDQQARRYHGDLIWLGKIRRAAQARYRDSSLDFTGCGEKVRRLIDDAVVAEGIEILVKEVQLFSLEFDEKIEALKTDRAKASEMEHAIRHEINLLVDENPDYYQSLRERLEAIIKERREERIDAAQQLALLNGLREDLRDERAQAENIGLNARAFAIYGLLQRHGLQRQVGESRAQYRIDEPNADRQSSSSYIPVSAAADDVAMREVASQVDDAIAPFTDVVDWQQKDDQQRLMRQAIKRCFRGSVYDGDTAIERLAVEIVDLAKMRTGP